MGTTAKADAIGKLEALPLCEVLVSLLERGTVGTLVLQERSGRKSALYFFAGAVVKAKTPAEIPRGVTPNEALGHHLEWVAALPGSTVYGLYSNVDYLSAVAPAPSNPLALLWRCARHSVDVERVERVIGSLEDRALGFHRRARIERFGLQWDEMAAIDSLRRGSHCFGELLEWYQGDPALLCKLVYTLVIAHHLDRGDGSMPVGVDGPAVVVLPDSVQANLSPQPVPPSKGRRPYTSSLGGSRALSGLNSRGRDRRSMPSKRTASGRARGRATS